MEVGKKGFSSTVEMQASSGENRKAVETELKEVLKGASKDEDIYKADSGRDDSIHSLANANQDTRLEAEPEDEEDRDEDAMESKAKGDNDEISKLLKKEEIKNGKKAEEEIHEIVTSLVGESSEARNSNDGVSVIRHMEFNWHNIAVEGQVDTLRDYMHQPDWPSRYRNALTPAGNSFLHIHVAAPVEARSVNIAFLEEAMRDELSLGEMRNDRQETPLHTAANFGQIRAVKYFLQIDPSLLNLTNVEGDTAFHMATRNKHIQVVKHMLELSSWSCSNSTNNAGETPLHLAIQTGCSKLVDPMLNTLNIDSKQGLLGSEPRETVLHAAVLWGNSDMVKKILEKLPELIDVRDEAGQTAFHYAAGIDNAILRVIIKQEGENSTSAAYIRDAEGRTAAHIAVQQNNINGLKLLVDHFPDCCEITDNQGRNVVHYAAFLGHIEALDFFLRHAQFCDLLNKTDNDGNAPLHLLASSLTDLPYASLRHLQMLLRELKTLNLKAYNIQNLTPGDIANKFKIFELEPAYQDVVKDFRAVAPKGGRVKHWLQPLKEHKLDIEAQRKDLACNLLRTIKFHIVVSTLVATVSFAAGLSIPGGFDRDTMLHYGTSYRVFIISDCIALAFSLLAILCYFWIAVGKGKGSSKVLFFRAFEASTISIIALMVAFMAGTYSILQISNPAFALSVIVILSISIYLYFIFAIGVIQLRIRINRLMMGPKLQKMKGVVLHGQVTL